MKRRLLLLALIGGVGMAASLSACTSPAPKLPSNCKIYRSREAFEALMGELVKYSSIELTIR